MLLSLIKPLFPTWPDWRVPQSEVKEIVGKLNYHYDIKLPDFNKEDVSISTSDGYLDVQAKNKNKSFGFSLYLGSAADVTKTKAKLENGKLRLSVPKKELPEPQKILLE